HISGKGFLDLLKHLRIVLLQDSVEFKKTYPNHPIWLHPVWTSDLYKTFARTSEAASAQAEDPTQLTLRQSAPVIAEAITVSRDAGLAQSRMLEAQ
ncbi:hypothetical protein DFS34DRAFT_566938, partial [Phlyctochytrium arcticum]